MKGGKPGTHSNPMIISLIAAMDEKGLIGRDNRLPWRLPADLKHFRETTWGRPVVMGRKTYESIGRALPGRTNIVVTRDPDFKAAGCLIACSPEEALDLAGPSEEVMIIGGASLYAHFLPRADRLYLTHIHHTFEGDTHFPTLDPEEWREIERVDCRPDEKNAYAYSFQVLQRHKSAPDFQVGDRVEVFLTEQWYPGVVTAVEPYSRHRSFHWVRLDPPAPTEVISVLNPKNMRRQDKDWGMRTED